MEAVLVIREAATVAVLVSPVVLAAVPVFLAVNSAAAAAVLDTLEVVLEVLEATRVVV